MTIAANHPNHDSDYPGVGVRANRFKGDPRVNKKQEDAIEAACKADNKTLLMGIDENHLPVIRACVGIPRTSRKWAIRRNGDPTDAGNLYEAWTE